MDVLAHGGDLLLGHVSYRGDLAFHGPGLPAALADLGNGHASEGAQSAEGDHLPEGRTTPAPGEGAGVSASAERRARVRRLVDALVVCQG